MNAAQKITRHQTIAVDVGGISIGGNNPIRVQSMTDTPTANIEATVAQIRELADAGSELVRLTVNDTTAADAIPRIRDELNRLGYEKLPLIGDFHYNGHRLLQDYPECAKALDKYRINPGNVGFGDKRDKHFAQMIEVALLHDKPVRIGVNWGSLDQDLLALMMDENAKLAEPLPSEVVLRRALVRSVLDSARYAESLGMARNKIILSCKVSQVQELIAVYRDLASLSNYALHLGLTEAGIGSKSIVATSAALAILLQEGIGDTIRSSLTPEPGTARSREVIVSQEILQTMGLRSFAPMVASCPGCGRTSSNYYQHLAKQVEEYLRQQMPIWRKQYPASANMTVAVMGCVVNGPGESKHANIGISLPGSGEEPVAPVFVDGKKIHTLRGDHIASEFFAILEDYVVTHYAQQTEKEFA